MNSRTFGLAFMTSLISSSALADQPMLCWNKVVEEARKVAVTAGLAINPNTIDVDLETLTTVGKNSFYFVVATFSSREEHEFVRTVISVPAGSPECKIAFTKTYQNTTK